MKPAETQTPATTSNFVDSNHIITVSSVLSTLKTLASAAFDDTLCRCSDSVELKNETGGTEPDDAEQVECMLHGNSNPSIHNVVIQTTSPCTARPSGVKASNASLLSTPKTLPKLKTLTTLEKGMKKNSNKIVLADDTGAKPSESLRIVVRDGVDISVVKTHGRRQSQECPKSLRKRQPRRPPESHSHYGYRESNQMSVQMERRNKKIESIAKRRESDFGAAKNNGDQSQQCTKSSRKRPPRRPPESRFLHGRRKSDQMPVQTEGRNETEEPRDLGQSESDDFWNDTKEPRDSGQFESDDFWNDLLAQGPSHACLRSDLALQPCGPVDTNNALHETKQPRDLVQSESDDFWA
jgi:hypothetical protein